MLRKIRQLGLVIVLGWGLIGIGALASPSVPPCDRQNGETITEPCARWRSVMAAERQTVASEQSRTISIAAALLSVVSALGLIFAFRQTERSISLAHPPRLLLTLIQMWPESEEGVDPILRPGMILRIKAHLVNAGRDKAIIYRHPDPKDTNHLLMAWLGRQLPLNRPYDAKGVRAQGVRLRQFRDRRSHYPQGDRIEIKSGGHAHWEFTYTIPADFKRGMQLYLMGYVRYSTKHGATRMLSFCRRYNQADKCFVPVDLISYELEE